MEAFWLGSAYVAGLGAKALRLPTLVGFLAAGLLLSLAGVTATDSLKQIGDIGVIVLLFTVGLHIRLQNLVRPEVVGVGVIHLLISAALFGGIFTLFGLPPVAAVLVGVALGFSSTVLTAKSLEARSELDSYHGRIAIGILIFQDLAAVGLLVFTGAESPNLWAFGLLALPLLAPLLGRLMQLSGHEELLLLFGLCMALGAAALFTVTGLDAKLGALIMGILLSTHERADELYDKLWGIKEVFLVGFFLQIGLTGFPDMDQLWIVLLLLALLPIKALLFYVLLIAFRLRARTAFMTSISLTAYSEFALIVGAAAVDAGFISAATLVTLALVVAVSYAINAPISSAANQLWARVESMLGRLERHNVPHPDHQPRVLGSTDYLVVGMGRAGSAAYDYIVAQGGRPLGLDSDPGKISTQLQTGRRVIFGDEQDPMLWDALELGNVRAVVLATPDNWGSIHATELLRQRGFTGPISALIQDPEAQEPLLEAGASAVCLPITQAGIELAEVAMRPEQESAPHTNGAITVPVATVPQM